MPILVLSTGKCSNISAVMSRAQSITSLPTEAIWPARIFSSPIQMPPMVTASTLDDLLLVMWTMMAGGAVGWYSKLQTIVALSTTEAEYMAAVEAGKEIAWMRNILSEFRYGVQKPSTLKMDNQSAITVSKNPEHHGCMKHLDLRLYWLRDKIEHGMLSPDFIPTGDMIADRLTSVCQLPKFAFAENRWVSWLNF